MAADATTRKNEHGDPATEDIKLTLGSAWDVFDRYHAHEVWWVDRSEMFERHGYRMRPRFRRGWVPSWQIGPRKWLRLKIPEDAIRLRNTEMMDVTRISDNTSLIVKRIKFATIGDEVKIAQMLSEPERRGDPNNHAVPIVDYFQDEVDSEYAFLVMPLLRQFDDPPFSTVDEALDCIRQLLEGIVYLHSLDVAHRDCTDTNIMMDPTGLFPKGFHPSQPELTADAKSKVKYIRRSDLKTLPRYYFIDFGISTWFREVDPNDPSTKWHLWPDRMVLGRGCQDQTVPELDDVRPYDPFAVDVYLIGNVIRRCFLFKYKNLRFLLNLSRQMCKARQKERPTAREALELFNSLVSNQSTLSRRWRLRGDDESLIPSAFRDVLSAIHEMGYQIGNTASKIRHHFGKEKTSQD